MPRKLFCEYGPICYKISLFKERLKRKIKDLKNGNKFAKTKSKENFEYIIKGHMSAMLRQLEGVDMELQKNKVENLRIAGEKIDGIIINPGEIFSFWSLVGEATVKKGYKEGLIISNGNKKKGIGGGLCQLANLIHYMVLHTPCKITEMHHHSDALFPDSNRRVPFGTGTSIAYSGLDYRFKNTTNSPIQIRIWQDEGMLCGEIRSTKPCNKKYRLEERNNFYSEEDGLFYRNSEVYRFIFNLETGKEEKELILKNHSKVLYDYSLIPKEEIRGNKKNDAEDDIVEFEELK